jgi:hypothetical protein
VQRLLSGRTDLDKMLPLLLITARAEVVWATAHAVEMERARGHSKVVEANAKCGKVRGLNLAFEEIVSLAAWQFEVNVRLGPME